MKAFIKRLTPGALAVLLSACAAAPILTNPEPSCYRPHWVIPFEIQKVRRVAQQPFTMHAGSQRFLTIFEPGPFERSFFFVMSPDPGEESVAKSEHKGVLLDSDRNGTADCFILGGGTLPDAKGKPVPYNFFAIDRDADGRIEEFISEDLDLDGDRVMDRAALAILKEPDPAGHFQRGAYLSAGGISPIPKEGPDFVLKKPVMAEFHFPDNEVTKMTLFAALQKIWQELQINP